MAFSALLLEHPKCRDTNPAFFFPVTDADQVVAAAFCHGCPEIVACGEWALNNEDNGVWGGMTEKDRRRIRRRRRIDMEWRPERMDKPRTRGKTIQAA